MSCTGCGTDLDVPLAAIPELEKAPTTLGQVGKLLTTEICAIYGIVGGRRVRLRATA